MVFLVLLLSCAIEPDPCLEMCRAAESLYGSCLEDWGLSWTAAGYEDEHAFAASCDAWAWEMRLIEDDAGRSGGVDDTCISRSAQFLADAATCQDYTGIDWSAVP